MMAYRRSIAAKSKLFYQQQQPRFSPSFSHISNSNSSSNLEELPPKTISPNSDYPFRFLRYNAANSLLPGNVSRLMRSTIPAGHGLIFHRNWSKVPRVIDGGDLNGVIGEVGDKAVQAAAVVNEVAVAAAASSAPVAAFQYLIDYVHCGTGFQWWGAIAAATFLVRFVQLPFLIKALKFKELVAPLAKEIRDMKQNDEPSDSEKARELQSRTWNVLLTYPLFPKLLSPISSAILFFAISNMAREVPSFAMGGTLWFMDLTTPDHTMRLPVLCGLTWWLRMKFHPKWCLENKQLTRNDLNTLAGVTCLCTAVTVAAELPAAMYCSWMTSNLFLIAFGIVLKDPRVPKLLGLSSLKPPSTPK